MATNDIDRGNAADRADSEEQRAAEGKTDRAGEQIRKDTKRAESRSERQRRNEQDEVTRESIDSFPASDPPSWTGEKATGKRAA